MTATAGTLAGRPPDAVDANRAPPRGETVTGKW
jgi:hypothetical protein